ncbi:MAG: hypothetical protein WB608_19295 [Terracidiphilus sp.]
MVEYISNPTRLLPKRSVTSRIGYDYGISARALLAIDTAFIDLLYDAKIVGCAYGLMSSTDSNVPMRILSLVAQNENPARGAFEVFKLWADATEADCVQVEILILAGGGYLLTIGPEPNRSSVRLAGYGSLLEPITMACTYVKKLDTVSEGLFDLRDYKQLPISPVMFTACVTAAREPSAKVNLREIIGCPELIKFELKIIEEADARRDPFTSALIDGVSGGNARPDKKPKATNHLSPKQISDRRSKILKQCFPVTLHRIQATPSLLVLKRTMTSKGIREWQVDQAICNLQISELCHKYLLTNIDREDADAPLAVLSSRFEDVLNPLAFIDPIQLQDQLLADARYLIQSFDPHLEPAATLFECAAQLAHLGVLNG